ncbi:MAG: Flp1 family type IVb pilin [Oscillospiraceae bacterium]
MIDSLNRLTTLAYVKTTMAVDSAKKKVKEEVESFKNDERGVDGIVVAIILILVVVLLAAVFWDSISALFKKIWTQIFDTSTEYDQSKPVADNMPE